jgi:aryl-alcohol dehydrogenase-like predicted oxidoreductase
MGMSGMYGPADERESIATIHAALDAGITLLDTGDYYGAGHNELLIGRALRDRRDKALLSVKFGALRGPDGSWLGMDARPAAVKNFLAYTLTRLGVDHIDIYRPGRLDPSIPIEETVGTIADLVKVGYVRAIGLSEVGPDTIRRAQAVHPISDLQIEYSLISRGPEAKIFPLLAELGIGVTAYGVLSRGLLSGSRPASQGDFRAYLPRFTGDNRERNQRLLETLQKLATEKGISASQLAIAWVLAKGTTIVPRIGASVRDARVGTKGAHTTRVWDSWDR